MANKKYIELYKLANRLLYDEYSEIEEYELLQQIFEITVKNKKDIAYNDKTGNNFTYAANLLVMDAYNYLNKYIKDNDINIHGDLRITTKDNPVYGGNRVSRIWVVYNKDFYQHIKSANNLNSKLQFIRKKLVFKVINEKEKQFLTLRQLNKFLEIRKKNPKYIEELLEFIIEALDSIQYKKDEI